MTACNWEWETCLQPAVARGLCKKHWTRARRAELAGQPVDQDIPAPDPARLNRPKPEQVVTLTAGLRPVLCRSCARPIAADESIRADLIAAARRNHAKFCPGPAA